MIPLRFNTLIVPRLVFKNTIENFRKEGSNNNESIAYWIGSSDGINAKINHTIFATNYKEFDNGHLFAKVPLSTTLKIGELIHKNKEILFAQIHSHPFEAFHSYVDDQNPISHRLGFFSIVVPYFGNNTDNFTSCKIYEYQGLSHWYELNKSEINSRFFLVDDLS